MFADSSHDVFCAVWFLRAQLPSSQKTQKSFIFGEACVAPMIALSIRKLVLQAAARLAKRLKDNKLKAHTININHVYMWTYITTVLQWLNSQDNLPVFVANRVVKIHESTTFDEWHRVLSGDNPADTGTRGISSEALKNSSWLNGPRILRTTDWPFILEERVISKNCLEGSSCDVDNCLKASSSLSLMSHPSKISHTGSIGKGLVPLRGIKKLSRLC